MSLKRKRSSSSFSSTPPLFSSPSSSSHFQFSSPTTPFNYPLTKPFASPSNRFRDLKHNSDRAQFDSGRTQKRWRNNRPVREEDVFEKTLAVMFEGARSRGGHDDGWANDDNGDDMMEEENDEHNNGGAFGTHNKALTAEKPGNVGLSAPEAHQASLHRFWGGGGGGRGGDGKGPAGQMDHEQHLLEHHQLHVTPTQQRAAHADSIEACATVDAEHRQGAIENYFAAARIQQQQEQHHRSDNGQCGDVTIGHPWARDGAESMDMVLV